MVEKRKLSDVLYRVPLHHSSLIPPLYFPFVNSLYLLYLVRHVFFFFFADSVVSEAWEGIQY